MNKLTLLCVEDDIEALEDIKYLLKRYFIKIYTALDGKEALALYKQNTPDIILLDINIPKLNGLEVASKIRKLDETTPIIFLTAHSESTKLLKAIDLQVSSYIIKPFKIQELTDAIYKVIKKINITNNKVELASNFIWDEGNDELFYKEHQILLTKNETLLIKLLLKYKSRFFTIEELLFEFNANENAKNNIVQLISRFKKKVKNDIGNDNFFIENNYGSGYRIK
jgi:DNA-binding response OmpR family regulator